MTARGTSYMNEKQVMTFLQSNKETEQNKGLEIIAANKSLLLKKHRFPPHFNEEDKDDIFYKALFVFFDKTRQAVFTHDSDTAIEKYLYRIISNLILSKQRGRKESPTEDVSLVSNATQNADNRMFEQDTLENVSQILREKLGDICRQILIEKYYWGKSYKEIAGEIGFQVNSAKNRGSSCLKELKKAIHENPQLEKYIKALLRKEA